jgi:hypothetical protein
LEFRSSYDDLDFLVFAILPLYSDIRVALVSHQNNPLPSIEICVRHDLQNAGNAISQTLDRLNLTPSPGAHLAVVGGVKLLDRDMGK